MAALRSITCTTSGATKPKAWSSREVSGGVIQEIAFYGDFLSVCSLEPLTEALKGCAFRKEDVAAVLDRFDLRSMFGGITKEELLDLMFMI